MAMARHSIAKVLEQHLDHVKPHLPLKKIEEPEVRSGVLKKLSGQGVNKKWKARWFILGSTFLYYYHKKTKEGEFELVNLSDYNCAEPDPFVEKKYKGKNVFKLFNRRNVSVRVFHFFCETTEEMEGWIKDLSEAMKRAKDDSKKKQAGSSSFSELRKHHSLHINLTEARHFSSRYQGDICCLIKVGDNQVRTSPMQKTTPPGWFEEFTLDITSESTMFLEVWDDNNLIGKVNIPVDSTKTEVEQWLSLDDQEGAYVSGELRIQHIYNPPLDSNDIGMLRVNIKEGRNLAPKDSNGLSDPYVIIKVGKEKKKTAVMKKNLNPKWSETFIFDIDPKKAEELKEIHVSVWDWDKFAQFGKVSSLMNDFMGQVIVPLDGNQGKIHDSWYVLGARSHAAEKDDDAEHSKEEKKVVGEVKVNIKYKEISILPFHVYQDLLDLLIEEDLSLVMMLGKLAKIDIHNIAGTLMRIFTSKGDAFLLLSKFSEKEIKETASPSTLFRGNTFATKLIDSYQRLIGSEYVKQILGSIIKELMASRKPYELDPSRIDKHVDVEKNLQNLLEVVRTVTHAVWNSWSICPSGLRLIYGELFKIAQTKWPSEENVGCRVVSAFFFLRFICPAITSPKPFQIVDVQPDSNISRMLTLVAKTLQSLANLVQFGKKEPYMMPLNDFILQNTEPMKAFLAALCYEEPSMAGFRTSQSPEASPPSSNPSSPRSSLYPATKTKYLSGRMDTEPFNDTLSNSMVPPSSLFNDTNDLLSTSTSTSTSSSSSSSSSFIPSSLPASSFALSSNTSASVSSAPPTTSANLGRQLTPTEKSKPLSSPSTQSQPTSPRPTQVPSPLNFTKTRPQSPRPPPSPQRPTLSPRSFTPHNPHNQSPSSSPSQSPLPSPSRSPPSDQVHDQVGASLEYAPTQRWSRAVSKNMTINTDVISPQVAAEAAAQAAIAAAAEASARANKAITMLSQDPRTMPSPSYSSSSPSSSFSSSSSSIPTMDGDRSPRGLATSVILTKCGLSQNVLTQHGSSSQPSLNQGILMRPVSPSGQPVGYKSASTGNIVRETNQTRFAELNVNQTDLDSSSDDSSEEAQAAPTVTVSQPNSVSVSPSGSGTLPCVSSSAVGAHPPTRQRQTVHAQQLTAENPNAKTFPYRTISSPAIHSSTIEHPDSLSSSSPPSTSSSTNSPSTGANRVTLLKKTPSQGSISTNQIQKSFSNSKRAARNLLRPVSISQFAKTGSAVYGSGGGGRSVIASANIIESSIDRTIKGADVEKELAVISSHLLELKNSFDTLVEDDAQRETVERLKIILANIQEKLKLSAVK